MTTIADADAVERRLTLRGHLLELRRRLVYSVLALLVTTVAAFFFEDRLFQILIRPIDGTQLVYTQVTEMISTYFSVALEAGIGLATPFILFQVVSFVTPALYHREKAYLYALLPAVLVAFACGAVFAYFVLLPPSLHFLLTFGNDIATPMISIGKYVSLVTRLIFWIGVVFETPVVIFLLAKIGILSARKLIKLWRWAFVAAFLLGGIITPTPDPVNQALVAGPLLGLYVVSIGLAYMARMGRRKRQVPGK